MRTVFCCCCCCFCCFFGRRPSIEQPTRECVTLFFVRPLALIHTFETKLFEAGI